MSSKNPTFGAALFGHCILFVGLVLFPAFVTAVVPLSTVQFFRQGETIRAIVVKKLLFVVPYSVTEVEKVEKVNDEVTSPSRTSSSRSRSTATESSGFLEIEGASNSAKVEVSPINLPSVLAKIDGFFQSHESELRLTVVANWKFGVFGGGLLSLLTLLYVYVMLRSAIRKIFVHRGENRTTGLPSAHEH